MKKSMTITCIMVVTGLWLSAIAFAQGTASVLSVSPVGFFFGVANLEDEHNIGLFFDVAHLEYQQNIGKSGAWVLRGVYRGGSVLYARSMVLTVSVIGVGVGLGYRGFFSPTAPAGAFWGIGVDAMLVNATWVETIMRGRGYLVGPTLGMYYRWLLGDKRDFAIGIGVEGAYYLGNIAIEYFTMPFSRIVVGPSLSVGFAW